MVILVPGPEAALDLRIYEWFGLSEPSIVINPEFLSSETLSLDDIPPLQVHGTKRQLSWRCGFGADKIERILDKQEIINTLSYEEHKLQPKNDRQGVGRRTFGMLRD